MVHHIGYLKVIKIVLKGVELAVHNFILIKITIATGLIINKLIQLSNLLTQLHILEINILVFYFKILARVILALLNVDQPANDFLRLIQCVSETLDRDLLAFSSPKCWGSFLMETLNKITREIYSTNLIKYLLMPIDLEE